MSAAAPSQSSTDDGPQRCETSVYRVYFNSFSFVATARRVYHFRPFVSPGSDRHLSGEDGHPENRAPSSSPFQTTLE